MKSMRLLALVVLSFVFTPIAAQDYYHGFGGNIAFGLFNTEYSDEWGSYSSVSGAPVPGVIYKATLGLTDNNGPKFAVSSYPFLGLALSVNSQSGGSGSFGFELPILGELHLGEMDDTDFFVGGGWNFAFLASEFGSGAVMGPQVGLGGQFYLADKLYGLRLAYTKGVNKGKFDDDVTVITDKRSVIDLGFYIMLGQ